MNYSPFCLGFLVVSPVVRVLPVESLLHLAAIVESLGSLLGMPVMQILDHLQRMLSIVAVVTT